MKLLSALLLTICSVQFVSAQVEYKNEDYAITFGDKMSEKHGEVMRYVDSDYIYTSSNFNRVKEKCVARYNREDLSLDWRKVLPDNIKVEKIKLDPDTSFFEDDGTCQIILKGYDKKSDRMNFYFMTVSTDGKLSSPQYISEIPLDDKHEVRTIFHWSKEHIVILAVSDYMSSEIKLHAIWLNKKYQEIGKFSMPTYDQSSTFVHTMYDETNHDVYAIMRMPFRSVAGIPLKLDYFLYKFGFDDKSKLKTELNFDDFKLYSSSLIKNPNNGDILISAFAGDKGSSSMSANALLKFDPTDLSLTGTKFYPIARESVEKLEDAKRFGETMFQASNSANFDFSGAYFSDDGGFYVVYENYSGSYHSGQYILYYTEDYKLSWEDYLGNSGSGSSTIKLRDDELIITSWVASKFMGKLHPDIKILQDNSLYHNALIQFILDRKTTRYELVFNLNAKGHKYYAFFIDEPRVMDGTDDHIFLNLCHGFTLTREKRAFVEVMPND